MGGKGGYFDHKGDVPDDVTLAEEHLDIVQDGKQKVEEKVEDPEKKEDPEKTEAKVEDPEKTEEVVL